MNPTKAQVTAALKQPENARLQPETGAEYAKVRFQVPEGETAWSPASSDGIPGPVEVIYHNESGAITAHVG